MFTGIVTDVGEVRSREGGRFTIACHYEASSIGIGASIACDGCCLTVTSVVGHPHDKLEFTVDVSNETLAVTTLGDWQPGRAINLERPLGVGAELGGHIVQGHIDGTATILGRAADGESVRFRFEVRRNLARYIAPKGSVALDGTSLTVNEVEENVFGISVIPHTLAVTTWGKRQVGDRVNLEVDLLARYVARLAQMNGSDA
jgi:riboflavin synthase